MPLIVWPWPLNTPENGLTSVLYEGVPVALPAPIGVHSVSPERSMSVEQHHFARGVLPAARAAAGVDRFGESHQVGARCDARFGRSVGNDGRLAHAERHGHAVGTVREGDRPFAVGAAVVLIVVGHERMGRGDHLRARRRGGFEPRLALLGDRHVVFDVGRDFDVELREFAFERHLGSGSELRVPRRGCDLGRSVGEEEGFDARCCLRPKPG